MDEYRREVERLKPGYKGTPSKRHTSRKERITIIFLISLIAVVIGSAVFLPHKIAGIIALGAFVGFMLRAILKPACNNNDIFLHPAYKDISCNIYHKDDD